MGDDGGVAPVAEHRNKPTDQFGECPKCGVEESRIMWGWHGVYYDLVCVNGHEWTYKFPKP